MPKAIVCKQCQNPATMESTEGIPGTPYRRHKRGMGCLKARISRAGVYRMTQIQISESFDRMRREEDARLRGILIAAGISLEAGA